MPRRRRTIISTVFLVNPASDNGATGRRWPKLAARARALGLEGQTLQSSRPGELSELAERAVREGAELIVAAGGDGTLNEVVNGIVRAGGESELATIPLGTGMDFVRTYGIPRRFDDAVRVARDGRARMIDVGHVSFVGGERYFANVSTAGMSGAVAKRANRMTKAFGGRVTFFYALGREFLSWQNTRVTVRLDDGTERVGKMHDVIVANGSWHGGAMKLAPDALPDDGLFEVQLIGDVNRLDFVLTAPKLYVGKHLGHPKIEAFRARVVEVDADEPLPIEVDGETVGTTPARWEIVPHALRIRVPG